MKTFLLSVLAFLALVFWIFPKVIPHPETLKTEIVDVAEEIVTNAPLILKYDAKVSYLTQDGVLIYTNRARKENGNLAALSLDPKLNAVAQARLDDMFQKQYFEHTSPQGIGAADIARDKDYEYIIIGENIALGNFENDEVLVKAWMDSPGHRANILNSRFTEIGIAVGRGKYEGKNTWIGVQIFARPAALCPSIDVSLRAKIDAYERLIDSEKKTLTAIRSTDEYNKKATEINAVIAELKKAIATYNAQVNAYNSCIKR